MNWKDILEAEFKRDYFQKITSTIKTEKEKYTVFPPKKDIFNAFEYCPLEETRVVILGQDVYHQPNQAMGLSFSVRSNIAIPPSLRNIFKELKTDLNIDPPNHGSLISWAKQGVLLLNGALTVRQGEPGSHMEIWKPFTDRIMQVLNDVECPLVFLLWGSFSRNKGELITNNKHLLLTSSHPSPFSVHNGFFGSRPFSKANEFLKSCGIKEINWKIENK